MIRRFCRHIDAMRDELCALSCAVYRMWQYKRDGQTFERDP